MFLAGKDVIIIHIVILKPKLRLANKESCLFADPL